MYPTLTRSRNEALLGGVCGGLASYLGINPAYIRLFFVLLAFGNGVGITIYLLLWLIIPLDGQVRQVPLAKKVQNGNGEMAVQPHSAEEDLWQILFSSQGRLIVLVGIAFVFIGLFPTTVAPSKTSSSIFFKTS